MMALGKSAYARYKLKIRAEGNAATHQKEEAPPEHPT
jgi:hypothetical protein